MTQVVEIPTNIMKETEAVRALVAHIRMLKVHNTALEDTLRRLNTEKLGYVEGYRDGIRDALEKIESTITVSYITKMLQRQVTSEIEELMPPHDDLSNEQAMVDGEPF